MTKEFANAPPGAQKHCHFELSAVEAEEIALDQYRRLLLEHGLRNKTSTTVRHVSEPRGLLYPFWVAYFRKAGAYDFKTMDAVSGEMQGVRMRKVLLKAFRQLDEHLSS